MAKFEHAEDIRASVEAVWAILANPSSWPEWFPGVEAVSAPTEIVPKAQFQWQSGGHTGSGSFSEVEPQRLLRIFLQMGDHKAEHTFQLSPHGGLLGVGGADSHLLYRLEYHAPGGPVGEFVAGGNPADLLKAKRTVEAVKEIAER
jgi:uncharacterized protein YndB with AHSA1/START domain